MLKSCFLLRTSLRLRHTERRERRVMEGMYSWRYLVKGAQGSGKLVLAYTRLGRFKKRAGETFPSRNRVA